MAAANLNALSQSKGASPRATQFVLAVDFTIQHVMKHYSSADYTSVECTERPTPRLSFLLIPLWPCRPRLCVSCPAQKSFPSPLSARLSAPTYPCVHSTWAPWKKRTANKFTSHQSPTWNHSHRRANPCFALRRKYGS